MLLKENHIFLSAGSDIADIAKPLTQLGITYFAYSRYYNNGGRLWLCNKPNLVDSYYRLGLYKMGNTECHPQSYQSQVALWSTMPNQRVFQDSKQMDIDHGIFIIEPNIDYCEFFSFATSCENYKIVNTYLTYMDQLKKFGSYFKDKAKKIIQKGEADKLYLPYHNKPLPRIDTKNPFLENKKLTKTRLSPQQFACAELFLKGKTNPQIGDALNLSARTVETYLNNIKSKLNCGNKTELIISLSRLIDKS